MPAPAPATAKETTNENQEPKVEEPKEETVTIKNSEDVKRLLEKVRAEEKKKLYPQIDHYKEQVDALKQQNDLLTKRMKDLEEEEGKTKTAKMSETEKIHQQLRELQDANVLLQKKQEALVQESQNRIREMELEAYRAKTIAQQGGELIPELVYGESEAEIDAAILASKERYRAIVLDAKKALKKDGTQATVPGPSGVPPQNAHSAPTGEELTADQLAQMSPEDWAKNRLNIRRQANASMTQFFKGR